MPPTVLVFTTSWPRTERDWVGRFVADAVAHAGEAGVPMEVLAPGGYRDFGLAYGDGVVANVRRRPWRAPLLLASMVWSLRRQARRIRRRDGAVLVHAHWLLGGLVARLAGAPYVVTLHGSGSAGRFSDLGLAQRMPRLVRWIVGRARVTICVSGALAGAARACGAADVRVIPNGVPILERGVPAGERQPLVLFAGRLSAEKGIEEFMRATEGLPRRVIGDGPLRHLAPEASGFLPHDELLRHLGECAVLCMPSRMEGFGVVAAEAMAAGTPVVASRVGGLPDVVEDGITGFLVEPGDIDALRDRIRALLENPALRDRMGDAARTRAAARFGWQAVTRELVAAYEDAAR